MFAAVEFGSADEDHWHSYFRAFGGGDWIDVAMEGTAMLARALHVEIEEYSPLSNAIHAVAAQGGAVAYRNVAQVLGLDGDVLERAMGHLLELEPDARGMEKLMEAYREVLSWRTAPLNGADDV
jgi:hypothetical protein